MGNFFFSWMFFFGIIFHFLDDVAMKFLKKYLVKYFLCLQQWVTVAKDYFVCNSQSLLRRIILFATVSHCWKGLFCLQQSATVAKDYFVHNRKSMLQRIILFTTVSHCCKGLFCLQQWITVAKDYFVCNSKTLL